MLFSSCCPCFQGLGWPWLPSSFLCLFFPLLTFICVLYQHSPTPIFCCYSPFSFNSFQISLTVVLPSILGLPHLFFPSTFWASANVSCPILSTRFDLIMLFRDQIESGELKGGALSVYHKGELVVEMYGGLADPHSTLEWERHTLSQAYSTTKGIVAVVMAMLVDR